MAEIKTHIPTQHIDRLNARAKELQNDVSAEGQRVAEETLALAEQENYKKGIAEALCTLGRRSYRQGDLSAMLEQSQRALEIAQEIADISLQALALSNIGIVYFSTGDASRALDCNMRSLELREKIGDKEGIASSLGNLGLVFYNTGDFSRALEYHQRSLALGEETSATQTIINSLSNIGIVYWRMGEYGKAVEYHMQSLALEEEKQNIPGIANSLSNIGNVFYSTSEYDKALEYFVRSLALKEQTGDKRGLVIALNNIGGIYFNAGDLLKAREYFLRSLSISEELGDKGNIAMALTNIGSVYDSLSEFLKAHEYFKNSLALGEETGDKNITAIALQNLSSLYSKKEFYNKAKAVRYAAKALTIAEEIGAKGLAIQIHKAMADIFEQAEDWKNFAVHFKTYHALKEEVHNEETAKKISNLESQRKLAEIEKEREIERREYNATYTILNRILPRQIVGRVKAGEENIADKFPSASVLFADIVGFTPLAEKLGADEVLKLLSGIFSHFDILCEKFGVEKIKTVGDSYMAASGVPVEEENHLLKIAKLALAMQEDIKLNLGFTIPELSIRIGIHTGEVIAGVLGTQKLSYDIWGDTVNTAARMESHGEPDMIHCTEEVFKALKDKFVFKERSEMEIKGKGKMKTYFLVGENNN